MKLPYFMKKLRIARLLFQPIFLISLALHGVVLMLPAPFDLDKPKPPKKEETVKITKLPATANASSQVSPQSTPKPTPESSPQQSQSDFLQPQPIRWEFASSPVSQQQETPRQEQIKYKEKKRLTKKQKKSALTEEITPSPTPSPTPPQPTPPPPTPSPTPPPPTPTPIPQPSPSPTTPQPAPSPITPQPTPSPTISPSTPNNQSTQGGYGGGYSNHKQELAFEGVLAQVKREQKLNKFEDGDISKLTKPDKFKDASGKPASQFNFRRKTEPPLTRDQLFSSLNKQLTDQGFEVNQLHDYEDSSLYEVKQGDFKIYLILAPMTDNRYLIISSETNPIQR